jgi:hypothetical protein
MNKQKLKLFLKIFFLLLIIQAVIVLVHVLLNGSESLITTITSLMITIMSFPLNFISDRLPFYSGEGIPITIMFWILNLGIQTMVIYAFFRIKKKLK